MSVRVIRYPYSDVAQRLEDEYYTLLALMGVDENRGWDFPTEEDYYSHPEWQMQDLPEKAIASLLSWVEECAISTTREEIVQRWRSKREEKSTLSTLLASGLVLGEILNYLFAPPPCGVALLVARLPNHSNDYGVVFYFWRWRAQHLYFQGIAKLLYPTLLSCLYSEMHCPPLNSLLIPAVESEAQRRGKSALYASPLARQRDILIKHYGFVLSERRDVFPDEMLVGWPAGDPNHLPLVCKSVINEEDRCVVEDRSGSVRRRLERVLPLHRL
jgi:hypothetical protein